MLPGTDELGAPPETECPVCGDGVPADQLERHIAEETGVCPTCEQAVPADRIELHLAGLDGARPECARQDLVAIVRRQRERNMNWWERVAGEAW